MSNGPRLPPAVLAARERLAQGREKLKKQHQNGSPGIQLCAHLTDLVDGVVLDLYNFVLEGLGDDVQQLQSKLALVAHGGYGRRDVAPYSDVDLMLLYAPDAESRVAPLAQQLTRHIFDTGLLLGFSARTASLACSFAAKDATVFTSLAESRRLAGDEDLFRDMVARFRRAARRRSRNLIALVHKSRRDERRQFGETVYLLEPNIKRSRGGLREIQLIRWIGFARYGENDPETLHRMGALSRDDYDVLRRAREFLLRLRNELHFRAGKSYDVLDRDEQVRMAELFGYEAEAGLLAVEKFMRDYFEHTSAVRYTATHFLNEARSQTSMTALVGPLLSHPVEDDFRVGPVHVSVAHRALEHVSSDLAKVLRLLSLANLYDKRIDHATWRAIRQAMTSRPELELSAEASERFLTLISQPSQLGESLRRLHQLRVLEKIIPAMAHARCLLQFNEYHKYTVDEHSIRAVERATEFMDDSGTLGEVYRSIKQKRTLHLALLLHDLGKGFPEDHSEVGRRLAEQTARHLHVPEWEAEILRFLVHKHLLMTHLALWRNIDDDSVVLQFAIEVGSPELLKMLYVLSCADLAAVGPDVLNQWKLTLLTELYQRALAHVAGESPEPAGSTRLLELRAQLRRLIPDVQQQVWWNRQIEALPSSYLFADSPQHLIGELESLRLLAPNDARAWGCYVPERQAVEYSVGTYEQITPGIFHKLTGALSSKGLQILSAEIHTLADGLVLDRFYVQDPDFADQPPTQRIDDVCGTLVCALKDSSSKPPAFRRVWKAGSAKTAASVNRPPTLVRVDNTTSERFTILDIFTHDRMGLLYTISRTLFALGLSVHIAKIGTHLDQVVDVFYVTNQQGEKIQGERQLSEIRARLLEAIEQVENQ
jgi:[protein-PII] uridylyltransferase